MGRSFLESWRLDAACLDLKDAEIMFPVSEQADTELSRHEIDVAKSVCRGCPVVQTCRDWAIDTGQDFGVWGAMTSPERRVLARERVA